MLLSKERRGLTRTLIGKAIELRNSIPWANPSQILLLDDPGWPGRKKVRPVAGVVIGVLSVALAAETLYLLTRRDPPPHVIEVATSPPQITSAEKTPEKPEPIAKTDPPAPKPPPPAPKAAAAPAPPAKIAKGTLVVITRHSGKQLTGASVRINGVSLGATPIKTAVRPGVYTLKVEKPGFKSEKRTHLRVRSSKKQVVMVDLKK